MMIQVMQNVSSLSSGIIVVAIKIIHHSYADESEDDDDDADDANTCQNSLF